MTDSDSQPASAAEHRKPVVFVAPLEGRTDAERDLAANLGDELRAHFARLTGMIVVLSGEAAEYRVEGGVRLGQGRSRVYARLVETDEGRQIWSDRYDEKTDEPFDILDLCAPRIASGVRRRVLADDADRTRDRMPDELTLEELLAAAGAHFYKPTKSGWRGGGELAEIALKRAPEDSMALAMAAAGLGLLNYLYDFREPASDVIDLAFERVRLALQQTSRSDMLHVTHSLLLLFSRRRYREALTAAQRALEINPNYNMGYWALGAVEAFSGDHEAAVASARRAVDVDSRDPYLHLYSRIVAYGYLGAGDHDEATDWFHKADQLAPSVVPNLIGVTVALWCAGDKLGAADALAQLTSQEPQFRVSAMVDLPYSDPIMPKLFRDCLAAAGAPR